MTVIDGFVSGVRGATYDWEGWHLVRASIFLRDEGRCAYCDTRLSFDYFHVDHIVPLAAGGTDSLRNLVAACVRCNLGKGARLPTIKVQRKLAGKIAGAEERFSIEALCENEPLSQLGLCDLFEQLMAYYEAA